MTKNEELINTAYKEHYMSLLRFAKNLVRDDSQLAEDIVQTAFIKLCKPDILDNLVEDTTGSAVASWLFVVVRNAAYKYLSRKKAHISIDSVEFKEFKELKGSFELSNSIPSPDESLIELETSDGLKADLDTLISTKLSAKAQKIVHLFYFDRRSYTEIAAIVDTSETNVGFMLHSARTKLRKSIHRKHKKDER